jgi:hypothetical protein
MADQFRRKLDLCGVGGIHCQCCRCFGKGKDRFGASRLARAKVKVEVKKEIENALID